MAKFDKLLQEIKIYINKLKMIKKNFSKLNQLKNITYIVKYFL